MGNYYNHESFVQRFDRTRRSSFSTWLDDPTLNVAMTLNFNSPVSLENARKSVGRCFCKVDRKLFGTRFQQKPERRISGVFVFEHLESNLHAHGLVRVPKERLGTFTSLFPETQRGIWSDVWSAGTQWTTQASNPAGFASYMAKEQRATSLPETMLFLEEFFPT